MWYEGEVAVSKEPLLKLETCKKLSEGINKIVIEKGHRLSHKILDKLSICTNIVMNYFDETCEAGVIGQENYLRIKSEAFEYAISAKVTNQEIEILYDRLESYSLDYDFKEALKEFERAHIMGRYIHKEIYKIYPLASEKLVWCHTNDDMKRLYDCKQIYLRDIEVFHSQDNTDEHVEEYIKASQKIVTCLEHAINMVGKSYFDNIDSEL